MRAMAVVVALACLAAGVVRAEPVDVEAPIVSVGLFKNGLAVVRRTMELPGVGTYRLKGIPEVVHGTFWIESDAPLDVLSTTEDVACEVAVPAGLGVDGALAGRKVTVHLKDAAGTVLEGTVATPSPEQGSQATGRGSDWARRNYISLPYTSGYAYGSTRREGPMQQIVLDTEDGLVYVDPEMVAFCRAEKGTASSVRKQHVLLLTAPEGMRHGATAHITYLAKGLAWAPSYRIDVSDPDVLRISQKAVVRNELEDLRDAEVRLISGFPSVKMMDVVSPMSPGMEWSRFFSQLAQPPYRAQNSRYGMFVGQTGGSGDLPGEVTLTDLGAVALPEDGGPDIHYQSIGKRTLRVGDALEVSTAEAATPYERIVEWMIPDNRDADGGYVDNYERERHPEKYSASLWDALAFRNPLGFPMTSAPAMVLSGERFLGQRPSFWVGPGGPVTVQITKALSIRARQAEEEKSREKVTDWWRHDYYRVKVGGELHVDNNRTEPVTVVIRRRFSGKLLEADGEPQTRLLASGAYSRNQRNELTWTVSIEPGASVALKYSYIVVVY